MFCPCWADVYEPFDVLFCGFKLDILEALGERSIQIHDSCAWSGERLLLDEARLGGERHHACSELGCRVGELEGS